MDQQVGENEPAESTESVAQICARYEARVSQGQPPDLGDFVSNLAGAQRRAVLEVLLLRDARLRLDRGEVVQIAAYAARFPEDHWIASLFPDLPHEPSPPTKFFTDTPATTMFSDAPAVREVVADSRYEQLTYHDGGGLGDVFRAHDTDLNREVALKFIKQCHANDPESRTRFLVEAEVTGRLDHPSVVPVYSLGESSDGRPFYAMRFIEGTKLRDAIKHLHANTDASEAARHLEFRRLLNHFVAACNTLAYAHNRGVIHCDVKPDNIMIGKYNETLVVDWGLAITAGPDRNNRLHGERTLLIARGSGSSRLGGGTPGYMSPEQLPGSSVQVGFSSDIYSLGATLYELLTGRVSMDTRSAQVIDDIRNNRFERPRAVNRSVPAALEAICLKAMATEPEKRYLTARALADDVQAWLADEVVSAYDEPSTERIFRWLRRHRTWALSLGAATLLVALVSISAAVLLKREAQDERSARSLAEQQRIAAEEAREDGMRVAARFAAMMVASEIDLRWRILEAHAADETLHDLIREADGEAVLSAPLKQKLKEWISEHYSQETTNGGSWFATDSHGRQIARYPYSEKTIGEDFSTRDYYHGQGHELSAADAAQAGPIAEVHLSTVFRSKNDDHLKVAFTVPVWDHNDSGDKPIGVLGMSVELGAFAVLQAGLNAGQIAVLVDTREDWIDETTTKSRVGLVLHHPDLREASLRRLAEAKLDHLRLDQPLVEQLRKLIDVRMREEDLLRADPSEPHAPLPIPGSFRRDYQDPVALSQRPLTAAFEPVLVHSRPNDVKRTGWVVVVQQRAQNAVNANTE